MRGFAWLTFLTGIALSSIAGYFSIVGLAMIFAGSYWSIIALAGMLEVSKLVAVTWLYRYRHLAAWGLRTYFYAAVLVLMLVTSGGIFGYLSRAHADTEGVLSGVMLTLDEINSREQSIKSQQTNLTNELVSINTQSNQLVAGLSNKDRLTGTSGAVTVQRQTQARKQAILKELTQTSADLSTVQRERIATTAETNKVTADIGPLRYVAKAVYGKDDIDTIRKSVIFLTIILMVVFDPMALMLLIAANILFLEAAKGSAKEPTPEPRTATIPPPDGSIDPVAPAPAKTAPDEPENRVTDIPIPLRT
jgi:hypothetical protein